MAQNRNINQTILVDGSVGIGTTNPSYKLQVKDTSAAMSDGDQVFSVGNTTGGTQLAFGSLENSYNWIRSYESGAGGRDFVLGTNAEVMRLTAAGNVGIGTTSPSAKLEVVQGAGGVATNLINAGEVGFRFSTVVEDTTTYTPVFRQGIYHNSTENATIAFYRGGSTVGGYMTFQTQNGNERMRITNAGNVGIGTTNPQTELHVKGNNGWGEVRIEGQTFASGNGASLEFYSEGTALADIYANTSKDLILRNNGSTERVRILANGNVGIGETNPTTKLYIKNTSGDADITLQGSSQTMRIDQNSIRTTTASQIAIFTNNTATNGIYISSTGNVGIGTTTPTRSLSVAGGIIRVQSGTSSTTGQIDFGNADTYFGYYNNVFQARTWDGFDYYEAFRIDGANHNLILSTSEGNVGIGTTSPAQKLHVVGNTVTTGVAYTDIVQTWLGTSIDFRHQDASVVMRVDTANARVGIGTTSPGYKLHVVGASSGYIARVQGSSTLSVYDPGGSGEIGLGSGSGQKLKLYANDTLNTGITIDTSGNVGIGTASPGFKLDVNGTLRASSYLVTPLIYSGGGNVVFGNVAQFNDWVGIGTSSPSEKLHVNAGKILINGGQYNLLVDHGANSGGAGVILQSTGSNLPFVRWTDGTNINAGIRSSSALDLRFQTNGFNDRMTINSAGNVGIGTTSPSYKIHAQTNAATWGYRFENNTSDQDVHTFLSHGSGYGIAVDSTSNSSSTYLLKLAGGAGGTGLGSVEHFRVTSAGNVGIGTASPSYALDIERTTGEVAIQLQARDDSSNTAIYFGDNSDADVGSLIYNQGSNYMSFTANAGERMRITSNGNVGIGTTSPSYKLDVVDQVRITNDATITPSGNLSNGALFISNNGGSSAYSALQVKTTGGLGLAVQNNGNVGIGTASPAGPLHVKYSSSTLAGITIENDGVGFNAGSLTLRSGTSGGMNMSVTSTGGMYWYSLSNSSNALSLTANNNLIINGAVDNGKKLQVNGDVFIKGSTSASSTKIFEVQNSNGTSIMDFRGDAYAFFGCGQGGGSASGFIFRYNDTSHVQFTGYNYGNGAGSYKPILLDTDLVGRGQGIYVNFGGTGYANPAPLSTTEFAVRGRTSDASQKVMQLHDSNNNEIFSVQNDGAVFTQGSQGWNGTVNFPTNAPGQQNLQFVNGILVNVF